MERALINVNGIVQGVGFRPFIHRLVKGYGFSGWVKNTSSGVIIEIEGERKAIESFARDIKEQKPQLSVIENLTIEYKKDMMGYNSFEIIKSTGDSSRFTLISPDVAVCEDCLREMYSKGNRRYRFPFINCTNCGPRFTIIKDIPYDREKTTMKEFPMCSECRLEYTDIEDRRYHAEPTCCDECGPSMFLLSSNGREIKTEDPIIEAAHMLREGKIVAIKGLGGFHLACFAENRESVELLRKRKERDEKPFAIMCRNSQEAEKYCSIESEEKELLESYRRPIVLLKKKNNCLDVISMDNDTIGVMLPYTPIHHMLLDEISPLVMTSGNISELPIIKDNSEAIQKLSGVADAFLMHNRDIHIRCDDSLMRIFNNKEYPLRRSRGYAPFPIKLNEDAGEILSLGAEQKASFSVTKGNYLFLSQHIGDMKNIETFANYEDMIEHYKRLFSINPQTVVCDLHPDYLSTDYGKRISALKKLPLKMVQHHHAHMASCMADNNVKGEAIGIIWDGTGYGTDGTIWGGEILSGGYDSFERAGTIRNIPLIGGDKASKEIERVAFAILEDVDALRGERLVGEKKADLYRSMIQNKLNVFPSSSMGRFFDGVACICGIKKRSSYEGQAAIVLEGIAEKGVKEKYSYCIEKKEKLYIYDWRDTVKDIIIDIDTGVPKEIMAAKFMNTLVESASDMVTSISEERKIMRVVLSGGVFQNMYILDKIKKSLEERGLEVFTHSRVASNDEGISVGQTLIALYGGESVCV